MTIDQAVVILEAERVLQIVRGCDPKSAWYNYVKEADSTIQSDPLYRHAFDDLCLLEGFGERRPCDDCDDITDVVFLKDQGSSDIYAVFPGLAATDVLVTCYAHVGQHSGCALWYCDDCDEVTDPTEYADLANELGWKYNLRVVRKDCLYDDKYLAARAAQLKS